MKTRTLDETSLVKAGLARRLGCLGVMRQAFSSRWMDVYENKGKRSGAYSAGVYGVGPFQLLNHNDTLDSAFTLAHEGGHAMHTVLSYENQPFSTASYTIFVAEVASTTNERFLLETLLKHPQRVLSKTHLQQMLYDWSGSDPASNALEVHVHHLRRKIDPAIVRTVRGVGYSLGSAEVTS